MDSILMSKKSAAQALGISLRTLEYLIDRGDLKARRIGRRVLIERRELERFARHDHKVTKSAKAVSDVG